MRIIVFNGYSLAKDKIYGVQRYTLEILYELDNLIDSGTVYLAVPKTEKKLHFNKITVVELGNTNSRTKIGEKINHYLWFNKYLKKFVKKKGAILIDTILDFPSFTNGAIAIHDCIPDLFPEYYSSLRNKLYRKRLLNKQHRLVKRCKYVITVSQSSKRDIVALYNVAPEKVCVIPNSWQHFERIEEDERVFSKLNIKPKEFFFSLGSRFPHKNFKWISCAAAVNKNYKFVVSGSSFNVKTGDEEVPENMIFAGYLSDEEIKALMKKCIAFIQPSLYEGFGIPPMEAMSVGAKCIVSNRSSLPEIYRNSVWYIDPIDYTNIDLKHIMDKAVSPNEDVLKAYSWKKSAELMLELIKKL